MSELEAWALPARPRLASLWPWFLALGAATVAAIVFIDRPLIETLLAQGALDRFLWRMTHRIPHYLYPSLIALFIAGASVAFAGPSVRRRIAAAIAAIASALLAIAVTEFLLKPLFGRMGIGDALQSNDFGFHPFNTGPLFRSFPSGHATPIAGAAALFWLCYPRSRAACAIGVVFVSTVLVILRRHFLGDVLAGDLVGFLAALCVIDIWNRTFGTPVASGDAPISAIQSASPPR